MESKISLDEFKSQLGDIVKELESNPEKINELIHQLNNLLYMAL